MLIFSLTVKTPPLCLGSIIGVVSLTFSLPTGPFSQVVWVGTRAVGVGVARGASGRSVVVARYWPPGNVAGEFTSNVLPPDGQMPPSHPPNIVVMSRTRQEAHFYVSTALEPTAAKAKRTQRPRLATLPTAKKLISGGGMTGQTVLGHPALAATLSSCRNGAVRTSRLLPVCCLAPPRPEQRWAQPSARGRRNAIQETTLGVTGKDDGSGLETARLSPDLPPSDSPVPPVSPRLGLGFPWPQSPRLGSPRLPPTPARHSTSPKITGSSRFATSPRRGSPRHGSPKHGSPRRGSPRCGSPRRVVSGRSVGSRRVPGTRVTVHPGVAGVAGGGIGAGAGVVASTL